MKGGGVGLGGGEGGGNAVSCVVRLGVLAES